MTSINQSEAGGRIGEVEHEKSIRRLLSDTIDHSKAYVAAEKDALTLRAKLTLAVVRYAAIFGAVAGVLALFGFGWLLSAIVAGLSIFMHPALAALLIAVVLLLLAYVCLKHATSKLADLPGARS